MSDPRWDHCACFIPQDHPPTELDCSDLQHGALRLAARAARTAALQYLAELIFSTMGWMTPTDGERLVAGTRTLALAELPHE